MSFDFGFIVALASLAGALLGLLLGGCQLPSPGALRPLAGQG